MIKHAQLVIVTDCGGSDEARYKIAGRRCFFPHQVAIDFFSTESMSTLHAGFTTAAHALSSIDHFGPLREKEFIGIIDNAAPRHGSENGRNLCGRDRKLEGEEIYALKLKNGVWVVGPNAGFNFFFIRDQIQESLLVTDTSGGYTPFRSMEVMVPVMAKLFGLDQFDSIKLEPKKLPPFKAESGVYVADWDSHGNIYLVSTTSDNGWIPPLGETRVFRIGNKIARLCHTDALFAGSTGEQTLTVGSLKLNGQPVYYIVVVGSDAHSTFGKPSVGTKVLVES